MARFKPLSYPLMNPERGKFFHSQKWISKNEKVAFLATFLNVCEDKKMPQFQKFSNFPSENGSVDPLLISILRSYSHALNMSTVASQLSNKQDREKLFKYTQKPHLKIIINVATIAELIVMGIIFQDTLKIR